MKGMKPAPRSSDDYVRELAYREYERRNALSTHLMMRNAWMDGFRAGQVFRNRNAEHDLSEKLKNEQRHNGKRKNA